MRAFQLRGDWYATKYNYKLSFSNVNLLSVITNEIHTTISKLIFCRSSHYLLFSFSSLIFFRQFKYLFPLILHFVKHLAGMEEVSRDWCWNNYSCKETFRVVSSFVHWACKIPTCGCSFALSTRVLCWTNFFLASKIW